MKTRSIGKNSDSRYLAEIWPRLGDDLTEVKGRPYRKFPKNYQFPMAMYSPYVSCSLKWFLFISMAPFSDGQSTFWGVWCVGTIDQPLATDGSRPECTLASAHIEQVNNQRSWFPFTLHCTRCLLLCNAMPVPYMPCNAMTCNDMQCNGMQCNGMQCNGMQCNGMQCNGMQCNGMQWCNAMTCNDMQCNAK